MHNRGRIKPLASLLLIILLLCAVGCASAEAEQELLLNGSFEQLDADGLPSDWQTDAYNQQEGFTVFAVSEDAEDGRISASINNIGANDARFAQKVTVEPESLYCLSGWIKADGILDSGLGANLSVEGLYVFSESVFDTEGQWRRVELYGETGEDQTAVTVFVRLGGYSGESIGKALFDSISLKKVGSVPGDGIASLWFTPETPENQPETVTAADDGSNAAPFWPWLLALAVVFLAVSFCLMSTLTLDRHELTEKKGVPAFVWLGFVIALAARLLAAVLVEGYETDVNCFRGWGASMALLGPGGFYDPSVFCDYPPAYLYVLWAMNGLSSLFAKLPGLSGFSSMTLSVLTIKLPPILCDIAASGLIYRFAYQRGMNRDQSGLLALLTAFSPAFFINSAAWCQMDSVLCLGLMLVAWLAMNRRWAATLPVYVLCVLVKPQALMLGFLGLAAIIMAWLRHKEDRKGMLLGVALSAVVAAVILIPFSAGQPWDWLITLYQKTLASYPYATVNTANLYYLLDGNWVDIMMSAGRIAPLVLATGCLGWALFLLRRQRGMRLWWLEPAMMMVFACAFVVMAIVSASWMVVGIAAMTLAFAVTLPMFIRSKRLNALPLMGGLLFLLLYVLGIKMHERYLFPALLFFTMAFVIKRDRRILVLLLVTTAAMFVNEGIILDNALRLGGTMGHLNNDTRWLNLLLSAVNLLCVPLGVWCGWDNTVGNADVPLDPILRPALPASHQEHRPCRVGDYHPDAGLHWKRVDWGLMMAVTAVYAVVALWNLGSVKAPQTPWKSTANNEAVIVDLGDTVEGFNMLYFAQVSYSDFTVAVSSDGEHWSEEYNAEMAQGQCFRWKYLTQSSDAGGQRVYSMTPHELSGRYVRITAGQIGLTLNELIFRTSTGDVLPAAILRVDNANADSPLLSDPSALLDEQDTLDGEPGWYNSTYFDEIYHARTAFEHLNGTVPYETTHPPLGKLLMAVSIAIFGMTPFGWRFAGALAGILMLPVMYLLGKQLTKRTDMAFAAMTMLALDCMHLTQTRIATIDSFPVLFIMLAFLFMLRFLQRDVATAPVKTLLPDLALSGLSMGLAIASKWIGIYAGVGLAVLYFWSCARHIRLAVDAQRALADPSLTQEAHDSLQRRADITLRRLVRLCLWCLLFFIVIPVAIYLLSYIPYFAYADLRGIGDFLKHVLDSQIGMLNYHSTPGLGMDHPFYSPWYEWPLIQRPMYYAMAQYMPEGVSCAIFCFGNPAVWLAGLAGIGVTALVLLNRRRYVLDGSDRLMHWQSSFFSVAPAFVLIGLAAQFLPWVLVPRGTYIYHYFASIPFLILGTTLLLYWVVKRMPVTGRWLCTLYLLFCLICFIGFYPYASGMTAPTWWLDYMKQFLRIYY